MTWDKREPHEDAYRDEIEALRRHAREVEIPTDFIARVQAQDHHLESVWASSPSRPAPKTRERYWLLHWLRDGLSLRQVSWGPVLAVGLLLSLTLHGWDLYQDYTLDTYQGVPLTRGSSQLQTALPTLMSQGLQYEQKGNTAQAVDVYQQAIDQVAIPLNQLAWIYQTQGEMVQGLQLAQLAVQLRPEKATFWDTLAVIHCKMGDDANAVTQMETASRLDPQTFQAKLDRFRQGQCE